MIGRQLRAGSDELDVLRALGARPAMTTADGLIGVAGAIVAGALLAAIVAVALSPLAPIGAVRNVYPFRGIAFDWTVLGFGAVGTRRRPDRDRRRTRVPRARRTARPVGPGWPRRADRAPAAPR